MKSNSVAVRTNSEGVIPIANKDKLFIRHVSLKVCLAYIPKGWKFYAMHTKGDFYEIELRRIKK